MVVKVIDPSLKNDTPDLVRTSLSEGGESRDVLHSERASRYKPDMRWLFLIDQEAVEKEAAQIVSEVKVTIEKFVLKKHQDNVVSESILNTSLTKGGELRIAPIAIKKELNLLLSKGFDIDRLHALVAPAVAEKYYRQKLAEYSLESFECELEKERLRLGLQLRALDELVQGDGFGFSGDDLFVTHGLMQNRVLDTSPLILADIFSGNSLVVDDFSSPWLVGVSEKIYSEFDGYTFRFGLAALEATSDAPNSDKDNRARIVWKPIVCIDKKIFAALQDLLLSNNTDEESTARTRASELAKHVFRENQFFCLISNHDSVHHMVYTTTSNCRVSFTRWGTPIHEINNGVLPSLEPWSQTPVDYNFQERHMNGIESFSHVLHRDIWNKIFSERPQVKERIIERAVRYFEALGELREHLKARHGEPEAGRMIRYLTKIMMANLNLVVSMEDYILRKPLAKCGNITFVEAIEKLNLPPYNPFPKIHEVLELSCMHKINRSPWKIIGSLPSMYHLRSSDTTYKWLTGPKKPAVSELYAEPLRIIRDIYMSRKAQSKEGLELTGFDSIRAILSFEEFRGAWVHAYKTKPGQASAPEIVGLFYDGIAQSEVKSLDSFKAAKRSYDESIKTRRKAKT